MLNSSTLSGKKRLSHSDLFLSLHTFLAVSLWWMSNGTLLEIVAFDDKMNTVIFIKFTIICAIKLISCKLIKQSNAKYQHVVLFLIRKNDADFCTKLAVFLCHAWLIQYCSPPPPFRIMAARHAAHACHWARWTFCGDISPFIHQSLSPFT